MSKPQVTERSNPAAVGWRWTTEGGSECEIAWPRGTSYLLFSLKPTVGTYAGRWIPTEVMNRDRWSVEPTTLDRAREVAKQFVDEGSRSTA